APEAAPATTSPCTTRRPCVASSRRRRRTEMAVHPIHEGALARPASRPGAQGASRRLRARALAFLLLALGAGLAAAWLITAYLSRRAALASQAQMTKVAVAAIDLPLATTLRP